jgi:hypothetical protein
MWQTWGVPKGPRNPRGLYASEDGPEDVEDLDDGPAIVDGRQENHLLTGVLTRPVQNKCSRGDSQVLGTRTSAASCDVGRRVSAPCQVHGCAARPTIH